MAVASLIISIFALLATGTAAAVALIQAGTAKKQSRTAMDSLRLQREAALVIKVLAYSNGKHEWRVVNQGRSYAREVHAYLSFDPDQREFGAVSLGDVAPESYEVMKTKKPLGQITDYASFGPGNKMKVPFVTLEWRNIDDKPRTRQVKIDIVPGLQPDEPEDAK